MPEIKSLVDINVFEDVFRRRRGWRASEAVIRAVRRGDVIGYVSALTPPILYFFRTHYHTEAEARRLTRTILRRFRVVSLTPRILTAAYASVMPDFEDAIQYESARAARADYVGTRNLQHFTLSDVPAISPEDFLQMLRAT
jgi:predicted nucleic acid-binding protein